MKQSPRHSTVCLLLLGALLLLPTCLWPKGTDHDLRVLQIRPEEIAQTVGTDQVKEGRLSRDPFNWGPEQIKQLQNKEPRAKGNAMAGLVLSGIIWDAKTPLAVINNQMIAKGESINELLVVDISRDTVIFEQNGTRHKLWLDSPIKTMPSRKKP